MKKKEWYISDIFFSNSQENHLIYNALNPSNSYKILYGLDAYSAFQVSTQENCIQEKMQLFHRYLAGNLEMEGVQIKPLEEMLKKYFITQCGIFQENALSLNELLLQYPNEDCIRDIACVFSVCYMMERFSHMSFPGIGQIGRILRTDRIRMINRGLDSVGQRIAQKRFGKTNQCFLWYEITTQWEAETVMLNDELNLLITEDTENIEAYTYYINYVHIGMEICAICDNSKKEIALPECILRSYERGGYPIKRKFIPFQEHLIEEFHL